MGPPLGGGDVARGQDRIPGILVLPGCSSTWSGPDLHESGLPGVLRFRIHLQFLGGRGTGNTDFWRSHSVEGPCRANVRSPFDQGDILHRPTVVPPIHRFPKSPAFAARTGPSTGSLFPKILSFPAPLPPETSVLIWNRRQGEWQSATRQNGFGALYVTYTSNQLRVFWRKCVIGFFPL